MIKKEHDQIIDTRGYEKKGVAFFEGWPGWPLTPRTSFRWQLR